MASCYHCSIDLDSYITSKVSRQDSCSKCGRDIRVCKNCSFYEPSAHWECREEVSEHVVNKEKANFCDFFKLNSDKNSSGTTKAKKDLMSAAEALFKKK